MVLALFNLELRSSRYRAWKGSDAKLNNSEHLPFKNSYLLIRSWYRRAVLVEISQDLVPQMVQPVHFSSCPIGTVYCTKLGKKLLVFLKNLVKTLLGFQCFCDISSILTLILAGKLSFWRENYALQDNLKSNTIQPSN